MTAANPVTTTRRESTPRLKGLTGAPTTEMARTLKTKWADCSSVGAGSNRAATAYPAPREARGLTSSGSARPVSRVYARTASQMAPSSTAWTSLEVTSRTPFDIGRKPGSVNATDWPNPDFPRPPDPPPDSEPTVVAPLLTGRQEAYERAQQAGNAAGALSTARELERIAARVETRNDSLVENYRTLENRTGVNTSSSTTRMSAAAATATLKGNGTLHVEIPKAEAHEADEPAAEQTAQEASEDADTAADAANGDETEE